MINLELWNNVAIATTSLLAALLIYAWTALALGLVFRKSGEPAWKAWVPILNIVVLLRLGGLSGWLALLFIIPFAGWVALLIAVHRINVSFGYGGGMTVLAFFLFPVWASILGFGPERWVGREVAGHTGPVRSTMAAAVAGAPSAQPSTVTAYAPIAPPPAYERSAAQPVAPQPIAPQASPGGWTPPPAPSQPAAAAGAAASLPRPVAGDAPRSPAPVDSVPKSAAPPAAASLPAPPVTREVPIAEPTPEAAPFAAPPAPAPAAAPAPAPASRAFVANPEEDAAPAFVRRTPAPLDPLDDDLDADEEWSLDVGPGSATSEVTDAVPGAPAPVAAAPVRARAADDAPEVDGADGGDGGLPPVTRVPAASDNVLAREPWAPTHPPLPGEGEAFPETSGPVSAIAGAPDAGGPRSALSSVSALHTQPHIPEDDDDIDQTIVARRKRTPWVLVGPTRARIPLTSETVILGRRPARDPEFPDAQLIPLDDDTRTISKTHARLELRDERWFITDLDSTNGVLFATLMGTEVAATPGEATEAGDRFLLGDAEVSLVRSEE